MLTIILSLMLMSDAQAQETPAPTPGEEAVKAAATVQTTKQKKSTTTNLYEQDEEPTAATKSELEKLTAKVRVVREDYDGVEVFFEGEKNRGTYFLHRAVENYATHLRTLENSKKPQGPPVSIEFDKNKHIKKVEKSENNTPDPNKTWDFSVKPGD